MILCSLENSSKGFPDVLAMLQWVKIARELGTGRSPTECFRAYIQSLALPSRTWRAEDDQRLLEAVEKHGKGDWGVSNSKIFSSFLL